MYASSHFEPLSLEKVNPATKSATKFKTETAAYLPGEAIWDTPFDFHLTEGSESWKVDRTNTLFSNKRIAT
jgi:hypothetical protein